MILLAPWPSDLQSMLTDEYLSSLQQISHVKYEVAKRLYYSTTSEGSITRSKDTPGKQTSPLLATCFGNRSAALYELGRTEVCTYMLL